MCRYGWECLLGQQQMVLRHLNHFIFHLENRTTQALKKSLLTVATEERNGSKLKIHITIHNLFHSVQDTL